LSRACKSFVDGSKWDGLYLGRRSYRASSMTRSALLPSIHFALVGWSPRPPASPGHQRVRKTAR
jgi:hypothetical protein